MNVYSSSPHQQHLASHHLQGLSGRPPVHCLVGIDPRRGGFPEGGAVPAGAVPLAFVQQGTPAAEHLKFRQLNIRAVGLKYIVAVIVIGGESVGQVNAGAAIAGRDREIQHGVASAVGCQYAVGAG